jgi:hypothetical protein
MTTENATTPADMDEVRSTIRQICHDLSNPVGVLRMAVYVLRATKGDEEKRMRYLAMMDESIDKLDVQLQHLRAIAVGDAKKSG